ncbi:MAG: carbohydrate kinase [Gammaproteobacteria bacterium]|nr:carbohydrate kinase [Gammaproteobacteria bacterium]
MTVKHEDSLDRGTRPLVFGEALFDTFPDGQEALGGAPFNVAWHLRGFELDPLLISRVGCDPRGARVEAAMRDWGMDLAGLQHDPDHPTGLVTVGLEHGQPSFDILADCAYDHIVAAEALRAGVGADIALIYHGTLALRMEESSAALQALRRVLSCPAWLDINLRADGWKRARVEGLLRDAAWIKLNDTELRTMTGRTAEDEDGLEQIARNLGEQYGIGNLILTLGERGAMVITGERLYRGLPTPVGEMVDTVGAGDAFSAVAILGHMHGWSPDLTLGRALAFSSYICGIRGAIPQDRATYRGFLERWSAET